MPKRPAPQVWLNGVNLDTTSAASALILDPLTITWGGDPGDIQPSAANANISFVFRESMSDLPGLKKGGQIEIVDPGTGHAVLAGIVQTMTAKPYDPLPGALLVNVNVIDWLSPAENEYISVDWPSNLSRPSHLRAAFTDAGWNLQVPNSDQVSAAAKLNSIKLLTLLERHISRYRGKRYDTSYRLATGELLRRLSVFKGSARQINADKLITDEAGEWKRLFTPVQIDGVDVPTVEIAASNVLNDPTWNSGAEDAVTAVKLSTMAMGDDGFSVLEDHNYKAAAAIREQFGLYSIDVESDLADSATWAPTAAQFMNDDAPWKMEALTVRDSDLIPEEVMDAILSPLTRYQLLVIITGIEANRPDPGTSDLRSFLSGGTFTFEGGKWTIELTLERTIQKLNGVADWWTCERVGASGNIDISLATCETVGDHLTVADFKFIGEP